jgi:hypothetical protein
MVRRAVVVAPECCGCFYLIDSMCALWDLWVPAAELLMCRRRARRGVDCNNARNWPRCACHTEASAACRARHLAWLLRLSCRGVRTATRWSRSRRWWRGGRIPAPTRQPPARLPVASLPLPSPRRRLTLAQRVLRRRRRRRHRPLSRCRRCLMQAPARARIPRRRRRRQCLRRLPYRGICDSALRSLLTSCKQVGCGHLSGVCRCLSVSGSASAHLVHPFPAFVSSLCLCELSLYPLCLSCDCWVVTALSPQPSSSFTSHVSPSTVLRRV